MSLSWVTATDENGNDFAALTKDASPAGDTKVPVWVFIDGANGYGASIGDIVLKNLKHLGDGKFGA